MSEIIPVILCGGSGTRLWPASREHHPKQFLNLIDDFSLLQNTVTRALRIANVSADKLVIVTLDSLAEEVISQVREIDDLAASHILREPFARNTAAAVALAGYYVQKTFGPDSFIWILPADHHIGDETALKHAVEHAQKAAKQGFLATFGIQPYRPETGYGYIKVGEKFPWADARKADAFLEKPDAPTAAAFVQSKNYLWNSGMFFFSANALLEEYKNHDALTLELITRVIKGANDLRETSALYGSIPDQPFDKAIMEKSNRVAVIPCDPAWSDIGSWESLWELHPKDEQGNVLQGRAICHESKNCLIQATDRLIACAGLEDIVIIETPDALLVADRKNADAMRALVKNLKNNGYAEVSVKPRARETESESPVTNLVFGKTQIQGMQGAA